MGVKLPQQQETQLNDLSAQTDRSTDELVQEAVARLLIASSAVFLCPSALPWEEGTRSNGSELHPDVQAKLEQVAQDTGRRTDELVEDAVIGYLDEPAHTREMLDRRYDDLESGSVKPTDGEEAYRRLMRKIEAQLHRHRPT